MDIFLLFCLFNLPLTERGELLPPLTVYFHLSSCCNFYLMNVGMLFVAQLLRTFFLVDYIAKVFSALCNTLGLNN